MKHLAALWLCVLVTAASAQELEYVKRATREATRRASLEASGAVRFRAPWYLIGPFPGGKGVDRVHPPEKEIDLEGEYFAVGGRAKWRRVFFGDGRIHNLKVFERTDLCDCYLYRQIVSKSAQTVRCSLGSNDGLAVWMNGKKLLAKDVVRETAPDQDFVDLKLKAGRNDLLLKITNLEGDWSYYFKPINSPDLLARLDARLNEDFPPAGEQAAWPIVTLPLPENAMIEGGGLAFRSDGKLFVGTRRGDIWLVDNPCARDPGQATFHPWCRGLHEILGLTLVNDHELLVGQRPEATRVRDTDHDNEADSFETVTDKFGLSGDYHEYLFGPAKDGADNLFITLNLAFSPGHKSRVPLRGFCLKIDPTGRTTPWAYGFRSPNGINFSPDGRLFCCDNQGEWVAACKLQEIREGEFYGHPASVRWWQDMPDLAAAESSDELPEMVPPAVWFPYSLSQSASDPVWDTTGGKFGPFVGQCFVGEQKNSLIMRVNLEVVNERVQGACFLFRKGFQSGVNRLRFAPDGSLMVGQTNRGWGSVGGRPDGLQRVVWNGQTPFEMHSMSITREGWTIRFTKPVDVDRARQSSTWFLDSYSYKHSAEYGSPEQDRRQNAIANITVADDGRSVQIAVPNRNRGRVFHLLVRGLTADDGTALIPGHEQAWYTMNEIPE